MVNNPTQTETEIETETKTENNRFLNIRRALFTVSNKEGIIPLAQALEKNGTEIVATGRTAQVLKDAGVKITPIERISGSPEAFQGRMKTLSFPVCSGILYRRGDEKDEADLVRHSVSPIDCVVVNFYPFEEAAQRKGISDSELIEEIDIGGPTLVRAAAKNSPHVLVLTHPSQYSSVIESKARVSTQLIENCAAQAWQMILQYDTAIAQHFGSAPRSLSAPSMSAPSLSAPSMSLRYGENPHQSGSLDFDPTGPIAWNESLTSNELSYNNILDLSSAYALASDLIQLDSTSTGVVIVKHNNPCGVALVPKTVPHAQKIALMRAWDGDPVSAFGGVVIFTDPIEAESAEWLAENFIELVSSPGLTPESSELLVLKARRKKLKAVAIRRFGEMPRESTVRVPGGVLKQTTDLGMEESLKSVTQTPWSSEKKRLSHFGIAICRALKSNAITLVREIASIPGALQLVGAGQGQPNRIEALKSLAIPRAQKVLSASEGTLRDCILVSDAFFPFRDTVDEASACGIRWIIQPGGSLKDSESITACNEHQVAMALTGVRHFRH